MPYTVTVPPELLNRLTAAGVSEEEISQEIIAALTEIAENAERAIPRSLKQFPADAEAVIARMSPEAQRALERLNQRTLQEIEEDRARIFAKSTPGRPLPPGKTWEDVIVGQWPGDETDAEIEAALAELS